jgi:hypothetical protein
MVAVVIDGPLRKENIGALVFDNLPEIVEMSGIQDGVTIDLPGEGRARLEYLGGFGGFGHSHGRRCATLFFWPLAIVQMKQDNLMT